MVNSSICGNCKKLLDKHTREELFLCKLKINDTTNSELTDEEWMNYYNEIKGSEISRIKKRHNNLRS